MVVFRFLWMLIGVCVTIQYGYWGIMFAGAWLNLNTVPIVTPDWLALGMVGAALASSEWVARDFKKIFGVDRQ